MMRMNNSWSALDKQQVGLGQRRKAVINGVSVKYACPRARCAHNRLHAK